MGRAVATFVKPVSRCVNTDGDIVFHHRELDLMDGSAFLKPADAVLLLQSFYNRLFNDFLAVRHGHQGGIEAVALHGKGGVFREIVLPGEGLDALKKPVKRICGKPADFDQNTLPDAQTDIGGCNCALISVEIDSAVFGRYVG